MSERTKAFKKMLDNPGFIPMVGCFNAISGKLIDQSSLPTVYMTGFGAAADSIGRPDIGLMTMTEQVRQIKTPLLQDLMNIRQRPMPRWLV